MPLVCQWRHQWLWCSWCPRWYWRLPWQLCLTAMPVPTEALIAVWKSFGAKEKTHFFHSFIILFSDSDLTKSSGYLQIRIGDTDDITHTKPLSCLSFLHHNINKQLWWHAENVVLIPKKSHLCFFIYKEEHVVVGQGRNYSGHRTGLFFFPFPTTFSND